MLIIGIDPASVRCGYAVILVEGPHGRGEPRYIECGVIDAPANDNKWARIGHISEGLRDVLREHSAGRGDVCAVETAYLPPGRARGVETLAEARGALVNDCVRSEEHT